MGDPQQILRTRIAPRGSGRHKGQGLLAPSVLEQHDAVNVRGLHMAERRRLCIKRFGLARIRRHAPPEPVCLRHVEQRIGIARGGRRFPFPQCGRVVTAAPRIDAFLDPGLGRGGQQGNACQKGRISE